MKALVVVDVQNDFLEGGALEVPGGNEIMPVINKLINNFELIVFTQDWHPARHKSFASNQQGKNIYDVIELNGIKQVLWPDHCVQNTFGSQFHKDLNIPGEAAVFRKGTDAEVDSYSGFYDNNKIHSTGLEKYLKDNNIDEVYICGLALDYCVKFTALDSSNLNFETYVITDATRAVNVNPDDGLHSIEELKKNGVKIISSKEILNK